MAAPPSDELPVVVSVDRFLRRAPWLVMAVKSAEVFSAGCVIELVWTVRRGSETDAGWAAVSEQCFNRPSSSAAAPRTTATADSAWASDTAARR